MSDIGERIRQFIVTEVYEDPGATIVEDEPLLARQGGRLESLGLLQLISFIEEEFDVVVDEEEVTADHFQTLGDVARFVSQKVQGAEAGLDRGEAASGSAPPSRRSGVETVG